MYDYAELIVLNHPDVYQEFQNDYFKPSEIQKRLRLYFDIDISEDSAETLASIFLNIQDKEIHLQDQVTTPTERAAERLGVPEYALTHFFETGERLN